MLRGETPGALIAMIMTGLVIVVIGIIYAETRASIPNSLRAFGRNGSFLCTWAIVLFWFVGGGVLYSFAKHRWSLMRR